jgi:hypothetical protein
MDQSSLLPSGLVIAVRFGPPDFLLLRSDVPCLFCVLLGKLHCCTICFVALSSVTPFHVAQLACHC